MARVAEESLVVRPLPLLSVVSVTARLGVRVLTTRRACRVDNVAFGFRYPPYKVRLCAPPLPLFLPIPSPSLPFPFPDLPGC